MQTQLYKGYLKQITGFTAHRLRKCNQHSDRKDKNRLNTLEMTRYNEGQVCGNGKDNNKQVSVIIQEGEPVVGLYGLYI